jgi:hypothetical protein
MGDLMMMNKTGNPQEVNHQAGKCQHDLLAWCHMFGTS